MTDSVIPTETPPLTVVAPRFGDDRIGFDPILNVTFCGSEPPTIHGDEQLDLEDYQPGICEHDAGLGWDI